MKVTCPECGLVHSVPNDHVELQSGREVSCQYCKNNEDIPDRIRTGATTLVPIEAVPERYLDADEDHLQAEAAGTPWASFN